jgi:hypothetical protein
MLNLFSQKISFLFSVNKEGVVLKKNTKFKHEVGFGVSVFGKLS